MKKIDQVLQFVAIHPGCNSYNITVNLGKEFSQVIYYAVRSGKVKAVKDENLKRGLIFYPLDPAQSCQTQAASEGVTQYETLRALFISRKDMN